MREIKLRIPQGHAEEVAWLAHKAGIRQVSSHPVFVYGPQETMEEVKVKSSTPKIKAFLSALFRAPFYKKETYHFSSHEISALFDSEPIPDITKPVCMPFADIQQHLWQHSHITFSFLIRVGISAGLLSYALIKDNDVLAIGAMIFTPFSPLILAVAFGLAAHQWLLLKQALKAFACALLLTLLAAFAVAKMVGGPLLFNQFGSLTSNLVISAVIGFMAAVADADDVGRHQLLGLAMAYPFVKFPTWLGIALALGFPDQATTQERLISLAGNLFIMTAAASLTYWLMGRRGELHHLPD